jgi:dipeptidyl aminopeptidase/acylaminoacyl peptidase
MKNVLFSLALVLGLTAGCSTPEPQDISHSLFNGRDLSGWVVMHGGEWTVEDGALVGRNGTNWSTDPEVSGSWLRSEQQYADFILDFEYAIQGNSGVFLRAASDKNPAFTGYEMQLLSDHGREPAIWSAGGLYDVVAASKNMSRPAGEWNQVRILYEGSQIQIIWNGEKVVDYLDATRSARGYIGLQNHDENSVVRFRNIRISEL